MVSSSTHQPHTHSTQVSSLQDIPIRPANQRTNNPFTMHLSILTSVLLAATALAAPTVPSAGDALANSDDQIVTRAIYGGVASPGPEPVARRGDQDNTLARAFENGNCKSHNSNTSAPIRPLLITKTQTAEHTGTSPGPR
jgi:hypothetical protein